MTIRTIDEELVGRLQRMATCVYLATEKTVADDLSDGLKKAATLIEQLRKRVERLEGALEQVAETPNAGWMIARTALSEARANQLPRDSDR